MVDFYRKKYTYSETKKATVAYQDYLKAITKDYKGVDK